MTTGRADPGRFHGTGALAPVVSTLPRDVLGPVSGTLQRSMAPVLATRSSTG